MINEQEQNVIGVTQAPKPKKKDTYYIASGFFNEGQIATVNTIEASLKGLKQMYFSPRDESIPFFKETNPENKSMMTKLIFNNNLDSMASCSHFIINLQDEDQGTLFEYGYTVGRNIRCYKPSNWMSRHIKVMNDRTQLERKVITSFKSESFEFEFIKSGKDFDFMMEVAEKYPNLLNAMNDNNLAILSIDDRDPINMFLVGYFYAQNVPVITYSRKGYGSNVMLVHSTYHCETVDELELLLAEIGPKEYSKGLAEMDEYLPQLRMNKQTWDKNID